ncbi:MAG TPA: DUF1345 domain-containing protein [Myxococcales bacterium]
MSRARRVARIAPRRAVARAAIALAVGAAAGLALSLRYSTAVAVLGGWNAAGLTLLALAWLIIATADAATTGHRAAGEDPGRTAVTVLVIFASLAGVFAVTALVGQPEAIAPKQELELIALSLLTVMVSWTLTHTAFTLRYAHLYYREDEEGVGGAEFPGGARPDYLDFAYLAFTVGMTFQVSDTAVSSKRIRHTVLVHAVLSFLYSTAILAFVLNLVAGIAG